MTASASQAHVERSAGQGPAGALSDLLPRRPLDYVLAAALIALPLAPFLNTFLPLGTGLRIAIAASVPLLMLTGHIPVRRVLATRGRWLILAFALFQLFAVVGAITLGFGMVRAINWTMFIPLAFVEYDRRSIAVAVASATLSGAVLLVGVALQAAGLLGGTWKGFLMSDGGQVTRYSSFLLNPNDLGLWMLGLGLTLGIISRGGRPRLQLAGLAAAGTCAFVLTLTSSRGGLIALAGACLFLVLAGLRGRSVAALAGAAIVGLAIVPLALPGLREPAGLTFASVGRIVTGEDQSATIRSDRWSRLTGGEGATVAESRSNGLPGWLPSATATAAATGEVSHSGSRSAVLTRAKDGAGPGGVSLEKLQEPVASRRAHTLLAHCRTEGGGRCRAILEWVDAKGRKSGTSSGEHAAAPANRWQQVSVSSVSPAGTAQARVRVAIGPLDEGERAYLDTVTLTEGTVPSARSTEEGDDPLGLGARPSLPGPRARSARSGASSPPLVPVVPTGDPRRLENGGASAAGGRTSARERRARRGRQASRRSATQHELTPQNVVLGSGYGGYVAGQIGDAPVLEGANANRASKRATVDNGWLKLFLEEGLVGLSLFVAIYATALWRCFSARHTARRTLALTAGALLVAIGARALSADVLDINPWNFVIWLLVGLALGVAGGAVKTSSRPEPAAR